MPPARRDMCAAHSNTYLMYATGGYRACAAAAVVAAATDVMPAAYCQYL